MNTESSSLWILGYDADNVGTCVAHFSSHRAMLWHLAQILSHDNEQDQLTALSDAELENWIFDHAQRRSLCWQSDTLRLVGPAASASLLEVCRAPAVDIWHDTVSTLIESPECDAGELHGAIVQLCIALNAHHEKRRSALAAATKS